MKKLKVLSIDWDYFVRASMVERATMFPDGGNENLPAFIGAMVWAGRYAGCNGELEKIGVKGSEMGLLKGVMRNMPAAKYVIANSHKHIYSCITHMPDVEVYDGIDIVNVDFHHDYYRNNMMESVDCGNWVNAIFDENSPFRLMKDNLHSSYTWIKQEDSDTSEALESKPWFKYSDIDAIVGVEWDLIFLCKSGMWSPPHLDGLFIDMIKETIEDSNRDVLVIDGDDDRWTEGLVKMIKQEQDILISVEKSMK